MKNEWLSLIMIICTFHPIRNIQLLALQQALLILKNLYQDKFEVIIGFYYGNYKTIKAYAVNCGISRQAMSKKLHKALEILRAICFEKLENLEN